MINIEFRSVIFLFLIFLALNGSVRCWKAVPASLAGVESRYEGMKSTKWGVFNETGQQVSWGNTSVGAFYKVPDENIHRGSLHSTYRFGYCPGNVVTKQLMKKQINISLDTFQETKTRYIYLLAHRHTKNFRKQCVVVKLWTSPKYLFRGGRMPIYYCQGTVFMLILLTIHRMEIHEFYLEKELLMPMSFTFEFYVPPLY